MTPVPVTTYEEAQWLEMPDAPDDFTVNLGDYVRVETGNQYIPFMGFVRKVLCTGEIVVVSPCGARMKVKREDAAIILTAEAARRLAASNRNADPQRADRHFHRIEHRSQWGAFFRRGALHSIRDYISESGKYG